MNSPVALLKADRLELRLGDATVLNQISLQIFSGERIAIIGPNGSGKTTLLRALAGRFSGLHSQLFLNDACYQNLSRNQIAQYIAVVAQRDLIDSRLIVADYVSLGQLPHMTKNVRAQQDKQRQAQYLQQIFSLAQINEFSQRTIGSLSGGQLQRVILARAFAQRPQILLLDEPTNHLDPCARSETLSFVRQYPATAVAALHDLALVPEFADRVLVMHHGRLIADGGVEETLRPELLQDVFQMTCFKVRHPETGKPLLFFEPYFKRK